MSMNKLTMARALVGALGIGSAPGGKRGANSPTMLYNYRAVDSALTPGAILANTSVDVSVTVTGARSGDLVKVVPGGIGANAYSPAAGLTWEAFVSANDTVKVRITNSTVGSLTPTAAAHWTVHWFGLAA